MERWQSGRMHRIANAARGYSPLPRVRIPPFPHKNNEPLAQAGGSLFLCGALGLSTHSSKHRKGILTSFFKQNLGVWVGAINLQMGQMAHKTGV